MKRMNEKFQVKGKKKSSSGNIGLGFSTSDENTCVGNLPVFPRVYLDILTILRYDQIIMEDDV